MSENIAELNEILRTLQAQNNDIQASAIVSVQGLPICSALSRTINEGIVSAMAAAIQSVSERAVEELARGELRRILIEGQDGLIIISRAGQNAILTTLATPDARLGMVFLTIERISKRIAELLD